MEQKVAELEKRLSKLTAEYDVEVGKRESLEKETADLKHQLESRDETEERVRTLELEITGLKDQIHTRAEYREQSPVPGDCLEIPDRPTPPKTDHEQESPIWDDSPLRTPTDGEGQDPFQEQLSPDIHDLCREQIQMLELKLADLEGSGSPEKVRNALLTSHYVKSIYTSSSSMSGHSFFCFFPYFASVFVRQKV